MTQRRSAKIIATLGPASSKPEQIRALHAAGADVFRMNFSHGERADHRARYEAVRRLERELGRPIGVLVDLQGPKIRVGKFINGKVDLAAGAPLRAYFSLAAGPVFVFWRAWTALKLRLLPSEVQWVRTQHGSGTR